MNTGQNLLEQLKKLLTKDERLVAKDGQILKNKAQELARGNDATLLKLLLSDKQIKNIFFFEVEGVLIFDKEKFIRFISNKEFLPDSYTAFKNKIGLTTGDEYLSESKEVVLVWPYKDCVLEGGMTKEDQKRDEVFYNETLAPDDIDRLLAPKVFTNFKRIDKKGEHLLDGFKRDEHGIIKNNLIIKGNNLLALASLKKQFARKVKLIYIDPPYAKKGDTFYNDNFSRSSWLTFMRNRLLIAKLLLSDNGVILVQIDINQLPYLQTLMGEVFDNNLQSLVSIKVKSPSGDSSKTEKYLEDISEYILVFAKKEKISNLKPITIKEIVDENSKTASQYHSLLISNGNIRNKAFEFFVGSGKSKTKIEVYNLDGFQLMNIPRSKWSKEYYILNYQKIGRTAKFSGEFLNQFKNKKGAFYFKYTPTRGKNAGLETEIYVYNGEGLIMLETFSQIIELDDGSKAVAKIEPATNLIADISWQGIANEGGVTLGKGKKPEELLKRIIEWSTNRGDLVMDYHLGTGTTCAVAHKMGRQYIGIEQLDYGENDSAIRLKNVIRGDQTGVSKAVDWKGGGDFVCMELAKWNENWAERIQEAKTEQELMKLWDEMKTKAFLSYKVDPKVIDANAKEFTDLSVEDQKKFLMECLDKNQLYVNYSEIDDTDYNVNEEDKKLNKEFYEDKSDI